MMRTLLCGLTVALSAVPAAGAELVEHRGIWLHPDQFQTPQLAEMWIERIAAAHLNAVYPLVWHRGGTAWFRSKLCPMTKAFAEWKVADPRMERIIPGLSIYSRQDGRTVPRDLALVRSQWEMCRANATHGIQFFSLAYLNKELIEALAEGPFAAPARPWYPAKRAASSDNP